MAKATAHLEAARQQSADAIEPRLLLARLALTRNDAKHADEIVTEVLKVGGGRADVLNKVGLLYLGAARFDRAVEHLQAAVAADASDASMWLNLGRAQAALGEGGPARQALEKALSLRPNWIAAEGVLAFMDLQAGQRDAAIKRVDALKAATPKDPNVHALDGEVNLLARDYGKAASAFAKAYEIYPTAPLAAKAYQARSLGKLPEPGQPLEDWLRRHPEDLSFRALLAEAYLNGGDRKKASDQYEKILAGQPGNIAALNNLAWLYYEQKEFPKALELARRAVNAAPRSAAVGDTLGWILVESGRVQEGLPILKSASEQPDSTPEIVYHYAAGLARAGSSDEARTRLQGLLKDAEKFSSREAAEELLRKLSGEESRGG
jgi:putative PEP-CTERM system TPR-repeat lipoprotein